MPPARSFFSLQKISAFEAETVVVMNFAYFSLAVIYLYLQHASNILAEPTLPPRSLGIFQLNSTEYANILVLNDTLRIRVSSTSITLLLAPREDQNILKQDIDLTLEDTRQFVSRHISQYGRGPLVHHFDSSHISRSRCVLLVSAWPVPGYMMTYTDLGFVTVGLQQYGVMSATAEVESTRIVIDHDQWGAIGYGALI